MKKFGQLRVKENLYNSTWNYNGWSVASSGPAGVTSSFNKTGRQKAKFSIVMRAVKKLIDQKMCVCAGHGKVYIEYETTALLKLGIQQAYIRYLVDLHENSIITDTDLDDTPPYLHRLVCSVFAAILFGANLEVSKEIYSLYQNYRQNQSASDMLKICDAFYYGYAKNEAPFDVMVANELEFSQILTDNQPLVHIDGTMIPQYFIDHFQPEEQEEQQAPLFTEPLDVFFDRCKKGEFIINYEWSDRQKQYIVPLDFLDTFIPTEGFRNLLLSVWLQVKAKIELLEKGESLNSAMGRTPINIKIMGKPGTGKTTVIEAVLASLGYPKGIINCKGRMEEDEIEGMNKFIKGAIHNVASKAGELHSVGGAVILEEFNLPDPDILQGALGQALVYPYILKIDGYREYRRHPLTIYFATMNIGTNGSKPMNEALSSRFPEGVILEDVSEDEFVNILVGSGYEEVLCREVYTCYSRVINYLRDVQEELTMSLTLRHCLNALELRKIGFTKTQSYERTFISQIYSSDPEVAKNMRAEIFLGGNSL